MKNLYKTFFLILYFLISLIIFTSCELDILQEIEFDQMADVETAPILSSLEEICNQDSYLLSSI